MELFGLFDISHSSTSEVDDVATQEDSFEFAKESKDIQLKSIF